MASYLDMQDRIISETRRTDWAGATVQGAIQDAIAHYKDEAFAESHTTTTSSTVAETATVSLPADFSSLITIQLNDGQGQLLTLDPLTMEEYNNFSMEDPPSYEVPTSYAIHGSLLYLFPVPDDAYTITWYYVSNQAPPEDDEDAGFWMNEAERMIRCYAKGILWSDVAFAPDMAQGEFKKANEEFSRLVQKAEARAYDSGIRAWS